MKSGNSGRLSASTKRTYSYLSAALMSLLEEKSFEKITTMDICKNANVPRATFYNHFDDKYDLLRYTLRVIAGQIKADTDETADDRTFMTQVMYRLLAFYEENQKFVRRVSTANYNSTLYSEIKQLIKDILTERMTNNILSGKSYPADTEFIAEFFANGIVYTVKSWMDNGMKTPKEEMVDSLINVIIG